MYGSDNSFTVLFKSNPSSITYNTFKDLNILISKHDLLFEKPLLSLSELFKNNNCDILVLELLQIMVLN